MPASRPPNRERCIRRVLDVTFQTIALFVLVIALGSLAVLVARRGERRRVAAQLAVPHQPSVAARRRRRHLQRARRQHLRHRAHRRAVAADWRCRGHLPRRVRRPQPHGPPHRDQHREPGGGAVDHLRPARARTLRARRWRWGAACWPARRRWRCWRCRS